MSEINGYGLSKSTLEQLSFKPETGKKENEALGQADFMQLLITQLENQDPLSPQDNTAFVAQLAQFSSLQGIENLNASFGEMTQSLKSSQAIQASSLVGHLVFVNSDTARVDAANGVPMVGIAEVTEPVDDMLINIYDSFGTLVHQKLLGGQDPGEVNFVWSGELENGTMAPPGKYRMEAMGLVDGETRGFQTSIAANVNSVTIGADGALTLNVDGVGPLGINEVKEIL
jgi:flagellar basal-body rod modification protein FlgD